MMPLSASSEAISEVVLPAGMVRATSSPGRARVDLALHPHRTGADHEHDHDEQAEQGEPPSAATTATGRARAAPRSRRRRGRRRPRRGRRRRPTRAHRSEPDRPSGRPGGQAPARGRGRGSRTGRAVRGGRARVRSFGWGRQWPAVGGRSSGRRSEGRPSSHACRITAAAVWSTTLRRAFPFRPPWRRRRSAVTVDRRSS